jgi:hypothetical protein
MGRRKAGELRQKAMKHGCVDKDQPLPGDAVLVEVIQSV